MPAAPGVASLARRVLALVALVTLATGVAPGPASAANPRDSLDLLGRYSVQVRLDWARRGIDVSTDLDVQNTSSGPATEVQLNTIAARLGSMHLLETSVEGTAVAARVSDQTLFLPLRAPLPVGEHAQIHVRYRATLRATTSGHDWLWSQRDDVAAVYRFIPWLTRATPFDRPNSGDPFVTPVAYDVRVTFTSTVPLLFATSGVKIAGGEHGQTFYAHDVRDFSFTASPSYAVIHARAWDGHTEIHVVTRSASAARARETLQVARSVIARYEAWLGPYPYASITLAETPEGTGMESPGAVWLPRLSVAPSYLIAHELGHQWFYAVVGNDQARDPFLDEAMTDFLARTFMHQLRASRCARVPLDRSIYRYSDACYYETIYIQGSLFIDSIRRTLGTDRFWATLKSFWSAHQYDIVTTHDLLEAFRAAGGDGLLPRFQQRFPSLYPS